MKTNSDLIILGVMSGSSLDGLDLAMCRFNAKSNSQSRLDWQLLKSHFIPMKKEWAENLRSITNLTVPEFLELSASYSQYIAQELQSYIRYSDVAPDFISTHGHTLFHQPKSRYSCQIGSGAAIAAATGIDCISDFRSTDIFLGGEGAPVAPIADTMLFPQYKHFLNLGGICNLSHIGTSEIIAFDISPCNQLLNYIAELNGEKMDFNGRLSAQGQINMQILTALNRNSFHKLPPPKSLANEFIKKEFLPILKGDDPKNLARTCVEYIAIQIAQSIERLSKAKSKENQSILCTGGGAKNDFLCQRINANLPDHYSLEFPSKEIIDYKEAILMALMGYLRVENKINVYKSVTGATKDSCSGAIYKGFES